MEWWEHAIEAVGALRRASKARAAEDEATKAERARTRTATRVPRSGIGDSPSASFAEKRDKAADCCVVGRKIKGDGSTP